MKLTTLELQRPSRHVARVMLNRPEVRNAFDDTSIAELTQVFGGLSADTELRAIVLGGTGKAFCAGADLNWMRAMAGYSWQQNHDDAQALAAMLGVLDDCPVPIVARIHGDCYAGGVGLAAVCDIRIASKAVHFCLSEARLGLLPATISPYVIRSLGQPAAARYFITAERFDAARAQALGFVHEVCEPEALDAQVDAIVGALVANGPVAVRGCKQLVREIAGQPITAELRAQTARRIADVRVGDEAREGVQSFLQKRKPAWLAPQ